MYIYFFTLWIFAHLWPIHWCTWNSQSAIPAEGSSMRVTALTAHTSGVPNKGKCLFCFILGRKLSNKNKCSCALFRARKQTFFVLLFPESPKKIFAWVGKGTAASFQSCCRASLPQPWSGNPEHCPSKMGTRASGWLEEATSLTHWDACPGGRVKQSAVRGMHGTRLALKGRKSLTVCCSPIEVKEDLMTTRQIWWFSEPWPHPSLQCHDPWSSRKHKVILFSSSESPHACSWHYRARSKAWASPVHTCTHHSLHKCCVTELMLKQSSSDCNKC